VVLNHNFAFLNSSYKIPEPLSSLEACGPTLPLETLLLNKNNFFFNQGLCYTGASALAIKLAVSWQARIQSYSG